MTEEEKELVLRDICSRLPYGVKVCYRISDKDNPIIETLSGHMLDYFNENSIVEVKPYLRPMSSMTDEEAVMLRVLFVKGQNERDFMNEHYFDYRGLIPMGLALEAPKDMYNLKINDYDKRREVRNNDCLCKRTESTLPTTLMTKAEKLYPTNIDPTACDVDLNENLRESYTTGYRQAIEDACEWIGQQQDMLDDCFSDVNDFADLVREATLKEK